MDIICIFRECLRCICVGYWVFLRGPSYPFYRSLFWVNVFELLLLFYPFILSNQYSSWYGYKHDYINKKITKAYTCKLKNFRNYLWNMMDQNSCGCLGYYFFFPKNSRSDWGNIRYSRSVIHLQMCCQLITYHCIFRPLNLVCLKMSKSSLHIILSFSKWYRDNIIASHPWSICSVLRHHGILYDKSSRNITICSTTDTWNILHLSMPAEGLLT